MDGASLDMAIHSWNQGVGRGTVVGSVGDLGTLDSLDTTAARAACDLVELRLDLLGADCDRVRWGHLLEQPLLMTARRGDEGGAVDPDDPARLAMLERALPDAAAVDLEVASIGMAVEFLHGVREAGVPWVASFHDFERTPELAELRDKAAAAREAGAAVFKVAAMIRTPADLARLADFQREDQGVAVATMGMGPLAVVSRLLCAQCGSVLNYGFLGDAPTAPGQWSAGELQQAIRRLEPLVNG